MNNIFKKVGKDKIQLDSEFYLETGATIAEKIRKNGLHKFVRNVLTKNYHS